MSATPLQWRGRRARRSRMERSISPSPSRARRTPAPTPSPTYELTFALHHRPSPIVFELPGRDGPVLGGVVVAHVHQHQPLARQQNHLVRCQRGHVGLRFCSAPARELIVGVHQVGADDLLLPDGRQYLPPEVSVGDQAPTFSGGGERRRRSESESESE